MGGPVLILAALASARAEGCEDPRDPVDEAVSALLLMDTAAAWAALERAEAAFGCGAPPAPETLARFWLVEGGLSHLERDPDGAAASFRAAGRIDPTVWIVDLGPDLLAASEAARAAPPTAGQLELAPIDPRYEVRLDLAPAALPAAVPAGPHLLQIVLDGEVRYGRLVVVLADRKTVIESALPVIVDPEPPTGPTWVAADGGATAGPARQRRSTGVFGWGAGGLALGLGERLERRTVAGSTAIEPAARLLTALEGGLAVRSEALWVRGALGAAPVLGGSLLWADAAGVHESPVALVGAAAGGVGLGALDLGVQAGVLLPSRTALSAVASWQVGRSRGCLEARAGANLIPDRAPEPAFAVLGAVCPESR